MACEDERIFDLIALTDLRVFRQIIPNDNIGNLITGIRDGLIAGGWTQVNTGTINGFPFYDLISQQSPWFCPDDPPPWYTGNIVWLHVEALVSSTPDRARFTFGAWDTVAGVPSMTTTGFPFDIRLNTSFRVWACPFQFAVWDENVINEGNQDERRVLVSAIHVPKFVFEIQQVKHCMFATQRLIGDVNQLGVNGGRTWSAYQVRDQGGMTAEEAGVSWIGNAQGRMRFYMQRGGAAHLENVQGHRIYNRALDPTITVPGLWFPFFSQARFVWNLFSPTGLSGTLNGWLWDSVLYGLDTGFQTVGQFAGREWRTMGNKTAESGIVGSWLLAITEETP